MSRKEGIKKEKEEKTKRVEVRRQE